MGLTWEGILVMLHANKKASLSVETHHEKKHTMRSFQYIYIFCYLYKKKLSEVEIQSNWKSLTTS